MGKTTALLVALAVLTGALAHGQDIAGIEDCTKTAGLDKRTGCFQSNIDYLIKTLSKNAADAQQKLSAAGNEIAALKKAIAELRASVEQLQNAAKKPETKPEPSSTNSAFAETVKSTNVPRHGRACHGHPRLSWWQQTWMAGTSPAMTWKVC